MSDFENRFDAAWSKAVAKLDISKCENVNNTESLIALLFDYQKQIFHDVLQELLQ